MTVAFEEDFDEFFSTADFALTLAFDGSTATFAGIFDNGYQESLGVGAQVARVMCKASDAVGALGRLLTVQGAPYRVVADEPDGTGVTVLQLEAI